MTPTDSAVSPHFSSRSGSRAADERCSALPRSPAGVIVPALHRMPTAIGDPLQVSASTLACALLWMLVGSGAYSSSGATLWPSPRMYVSHAFRLFGRVLRDAGSAGVLPDDLERHRGDRVASRARRVDRRELQARGRVGALAGRRGGVERRRDPLAVSVLHGSRREVVLQRVRLLDVADRAGSLLDAAGDAVVASRAGAGRPLDALVDAGAVGPRSRVVGEELGEVRRRAGLVRAVADGDVRVGQVDAGVQRRDLLVVPLRDSAEVDVGDRRAVESQARLDAVEVVRDGDRAERDRQVDGRALVSTGRDLFRLHDRVAAARSRPCRRSAGRCPRRSRPAGS